MFLRYNSSIRKNVGAIYRKFSFKILALDLFIRLHYLNSFISIIFRLPFTVRSTDSLYTPLTDHFLNHFLVMMFHLRVYMRVQ